MTSAERPRHLRGQGLLLLDESRVELVDYWLVSRHDDSAGQGATTGWIAAKLAVLEGLWPSEGLVTLVLNDGRSLQLQLTSEFGACVVIVPPA